MKLADFIGHRSRIVEHWADEIFISCEPQYWGIRQHNTWFTSCFKKILFDSICARAMLYYVWTPVEVENKS